MTAFNPAETVAALTLAVSEKHTGAAREGVLIALSVVHAIAAGCVPGIGVVQDQTCNRPRASARPSRSSPGGDTPRGSSQVDGATMTSTPTA